MSDRKIKANRANARASTGPKTAQGRVRTARNALRHALSIPVCFNPALSEEVETLAREIAGPGADAETKELAPESPKRRSICAACDMPAINCCPAHWPILIMSPEKTRGRRRHFSAFSFRRTRRTCRWKTWWHF